VFDRELSAWLHTAFDMRLNADYKELVAISHDEVVMALQHAMSFVSHVKIYLSQLLTESSDTESQEG
jgi:uncharacterized protein (UPF0332 family)